jgi:hypothetical protein
VNLSKPDVQINQIFKRFGHCSSAASYCEVFRAVDRIAHNVEVSLYNVDKLFWLVGSGHFYDGPLGKSCRRHRAARKGVHRRSPAKTGANRERDGPSLAPRMPAGKGCSTSAMSAHAQQRC